MVSSFAFHEPDRYRPPPSWISYGTELELWWLKLLISPYLSTPSLIYAYERKPTMMDRPFDKPECQRPPVQHNQLMFDAPIHMQPHLRRNTKNIIYSPPRFLPHAPTQRESWFPGEIPIRVWPVTHRTITVIIMMAIRVTIRDLRRAHYRRDLKCVLLSKRGNCCWTGHID